MPTVEELRTQGRLPAGWAPTTARNYAGFWRRVGAAIVDFIILFVAVGWWNLILFDGVVEQLIPSVIGLAYYWWMEAGGATLGKRALGIKVIDAMGQPPGYSRSAVRQVFDAAFTVFSLIPGGLGIALVVLSSIVGIVDVLWMLGDDDKQTLHDKLAGTYVVRS